MYLLKFGKDYLIQTYSINMSEFSLKIDLNVVEEIKRHNIRFEELFVMGCYYLKQGVILNNYLKDNSAEQNIVYLQPMVRKQLLFTTKSYTELVDDFSLDNYVLTDYSEKILAGIWQSETTNVEVKQFIKELKETVTPTNEFDVKTQQYLDIFPRVKNGGNKAIRSNFIDTKAKLIKFFNKYKRYDWNIVLGATEAFVAKYNRDYTYCPTAEYFIMKDNSSALAAECDMYIAQGNTRAIMERKGKYIPDNPFENKM